MAVNGKKAQVSEAADNGVAITIEYSDAVSWAVENNVTLGTSETTFSPYDICSRGQIVTFLNRAISE